MAANPFADIPKEAFSETPLMIEAEKIPLESEPPKVKPAIKAGGKSAFQPAENTDFGGEMGEAMSFSEEDIFDFVVESFDKKVGEAPQGQTSQQKSAYNQAKRPTAPTEVFDPEQIEVAAVMYVEVLEMVTVIVCEWIAGVPGAYGFKKTIKEKYAVISAKVMEHEKVMVSPMHLFILATIVILGGSVYNAFKEKKRRLKLAEFTQKSNRRNDLTNPGQQTTLFDIEPIVQGRTKFEAVMDEGIAYYVQKPTGGYCKKSDREQVPPELVAELFNFHNRNGSWPTKKQVEAFLKQP